MNPRQRRYGIRLFTAATLLAPASLVSSAPAEAAVPTGWTTLVNRNSGRCVDAAAAASANGTAVQQYSCNGTNAQQWQLQPTDSGYVRIANLNDATKVIDVTDVSTTDGAKLQLWAYGGGANQQWLPVEEAGGGYHLVNRNSGKCLDVPAASTTDGVVLQQYACNGTTAQSFTFGTPVTPGNPDLGPNVAVFDPSMSAASIQSKLNAVFQQQETNQFGTQRQALLFKPGSYNVDANVGFYTQVAGLGLSPTTSPSTAGCTPRRTGSRATRPRTSGARPRTSRSTRPPAPTVGRSRRPPRTAGCTSGATSSWTTAAGPAAG